VRVALAELDTAWRDEAANRARIRALAPDADVVVLPEMAFSGFAVDAAPDPDAEPFLAALARERGRAMVAGYVGEGPRNTAGCFGTDGTRLARYVSSSLAVGPKGDVLHEGDGVVAIDVEDARRWRAEFPALRDVRRDRYFR
jgi:predicted amidohydrolase